MKISKVENIDLETLQKIMGSTKITDSQKIEFLKSNRAEIRNLLHIDITSSEFKGIMKNRPLQKGLFFYTTHTWYAHFYKFTQKKTVFAVFLFLIVG